MRDFDMEMVGWVSGCRFAYKRVSFQSGGWETFFCFMSRKGKSGECLLSLRH